MDQSGDWILGSRPAWVFGSAQVPMKCRGFSSRELYTDFVKFAVGPALGPGQTHLEAQALDLVREMLLRGESRWKTEHAGMVWVGEFRCAKSAIFCSKVPVSMVFLVFFCLKMGVCVYR
jgi:hypothetical protein